MARFKGYIPSRTRSLLLGAMAATVSFVAVLSHTPAFAASRAVASPTSVAQACANCLPTPPPTVTPAPPTGGRPGLTPTAPAPHCDPCTTTPPTKTPPKPVEHETPRWNVDARIGISFQLQDDETRNCLETFGVAKLTSGSQFERGLERAVQDFKIKNQLRRDMARLNKSIEKAMPPKLPTWASYDFKSSFTAAATPPIAKAPPSTQLTRHFDAAAHAKKLEAAELKKTDRWLASSSAKALGVTATADKSCAVTTDCTITRTRAAPRIFVALNTQYGRP